MDFFNKLGKKASEAYKVTADKTGKVAKETKIKMQISDLKSEINTIYEEIGKAIYENHVREEKQDLTKTLEEKCTKIDCLSDEIQTKLNECLELKDKRRCEKCYTEIDKDVKFCPQCGEKQEEIVEEPAKEVEVIEKEDEKEKSNIERTVEIESDVREDNEDSTNK